MRTYEYQGGPDPLTGKRQIIFEDATCTPGRLTVKAHPDEIARARDLFAAMSTEPCLIVASALIPRNQLHVHAHPQDFDNVVHTFADPSVKPATDVEIQAALTRIVESQEVNSGRGELSTAELSPSHSPPLPYDPRLKDAMAEIAALLQRYDIGASVHLVSQTHSEYCYHFPTWSVAQFAQEEPGRWGIRVRSKKEDFPSREAQHQANEVTAHLLCQLRDLGAQDLVQIEQVLEMVEKHWQIRHTPFFKHKPHGKD